MVKKSKKLSKTRGALKLKKVDYLGINHDVVLEKFEGDLTFVNYMCISGTPAAVYHAKSPNREKGHKDYMLLFTQYNPALGRSQLYVSGRSKEEMKKEAVHNGVLCLGCDTVLVSLSGHHFHGCGCDNETFIDGGKNYIRAGGKTLDLIQDVKVNMLTDKITVEPKVKRHGA